MNIEQQHGDDTIAPLEFRMQRVLLADDDHDLRLLIARAMRMDGYEVIEFSDGLTLLEHLGASLLDERADERPDLLVSDIRMPGFSGLEILSRLRASCWRLPVILISAYDDEAVRSEAAQYEVSTLFHKPFAFDDFRTAVFHMTHRH